MSMIPFFYVKEHKFGLEIEQKGKCLEEELRRKVVEVEKKETIFNYMKAKVAKGEHALESKIYKLLGK